MIEFEVNGRQCRVYGYESPDAPEGYRGVARMMIQQHGTGNKLVLKWDTICTVAATMEEAMAKAQANFTVAVEAEMLKNRNYQIAAEKRAARLEAKA